MVQTRAQKQAAEKELVEYFKAKKIERQVQEQAEIFSEIAFDCLMEHRYWQQLPSRGTNQWFNDRLTQGIRKADNQLELIINQIYPNQFNKCHLYHQVQDYIAEHSQNLNSTYSYAPAAFKQMFLEFKI